MTSLKDNMEGEMQSAVSDYVQKMEAQGIYEEIIIWDTRNFFVFVSLLQARENCVFGNVEVIILLIFQNNAIIFKMEE